MQWVFSRGLKTWDAFAALFIAITFTEVIWKDDRFFDLPDTISLLIIIRPFLPLGTYVGTLFYITKCFVICATMLYAKYIFF